MSPSASSRCTLDGRPALASASLDAVSSTSVPGVSTVSPSVICSLTWNSCFTRMRCRERHREIVGSALLLLVLAPGGLHRGLGLALCLRLALRLLALRLGVLLDGDRLLRSGDLGRRDLALRAVALLLGLRGRGAGSRVVADHVELLGHRPQVRDRPVDEH